MSICYVNVVGGLGNQLFQIAAGYAYSKKYDKKLIINPSNWNAGQGNSPTTYKDTIFKNFEYGVPLTRDVIGIHEKQFNYSEIPYYPGSVALNGYYQSLKYFEDVKDEFISMLELPEIELKKIIGGPTYIGFHIRRGDYLTHASIHYVCDTKYFEYFMDIFGPPDLKDNIFLVFTDSFEHVKNEFCEYDLNIVKSHSDVKDLVAMSQCDIIVGSNSTFSWWASLIGDKPCYFPSKWFADGRDDKDIYRKDMVLYNV
jgi:hypothetical protein